MALNAPQYDLGTQTPNYPFERTHQPISAILSDLPQLQRENAKGHTLTLTPHDPHHTLVMLDSLTTAQITDLKQESLDPCLILQTGLDQHQAWLRLSDTPLTTEQKTEIIKQLKEKSPVFEQTYATHLTGLLAGFEHCTNAMAGRTQPVRCLHASQAVSTLSKELLLDVNQQLKERDAEKACQERFSQIEASTLPINHRLYHRAYRLEFLRQLKEHPNDLETVDFKTCSNLILDQYQPDTLAETVREYSPVIPMKELRGDFDYAEQLVKHVLQTPEIVQALESRQSRDHELDWGR